MITGLERRLIESRGTPDERKQLRLVDKKFDQLYNEGKTVEITVKQINHPAFIGALSKLDNCTKFPTAQQSWNVMKIVKQCHEAIKDQRDLYKKMVRAYAQLDENGEIKLTDNKEIVYIDAAAEKEHEAKFEEFMASVIKVDGSPLPIQALDHAGIAPIELDAIVCLIDTESV